MKTLTLFIQPGILEQIGHGRIAKFLHGFEADLRQSSLTLATEENPPNDWPDRLAAFFVSTDALPAGLLRAMSTLENAATPENETHLNALIQAHIPNVSLNHSCPLDCALELWFTSPKLLVESSSSSSSFSSSLGDSEVQGSTVQGSAVQDSEPTTHGQNLNLNVEDVQPWPQPVTVSALLDELAADLTRFVICDMKLHSVLLGWSNPDQALRVTAGIPRKHASDGRWPSGRYCQGYEAFPVM